MVTRRDYSQEATDAAFSVLLEIVKVLGEYMDGIALIGGWVPELLLTESAEKHIRSTDVDLALNHHVLEEPGYETICELLKASQYEQDADQPFIFRRTFIMNDRSWTVQVDLLAGEYGGTGRSHRTQKVQDARPRKARGCDLVFDLCQEVTIQGVRPDGYRDSAKIRIATIVSFLVMKGMALASRNKEKDAYDIYFCLKNYPQGLDSLAEEIRPHLSNKLVREGLENIAAKFASPEHVGPGQVADFEDIEDPEERDMLQRDVFERVHYPLGKLGIAGQGEE